MKKIASIFVLIFSLLNLCSCTGKDEPETTLPDDEMLTQATQQNDETQNTTELSTTEKPENSNETTALSTTQTTQAATDSGEENVPPPILYLRSYEDIADFFRSTQTMTDEEFEEYDKFYPFTRQQALEMIEACKDVYIPTITGDGTDVNFIAVYPESGAMSVIYEFENEYNFVFNYEISLGVRLFEYELSKDMDDATELLSTSANGAEIDIVWRSEYGRYCGNISYNGCRFNFATNCKEHSEYMANDVKGKSEQFKYIKLSEIA